MDKSIIEIVNKNFINVNIFTTLTNTYYIVGELRDSRYMVSKQTYYIVTKRIDGIDKYMGVYQKFDEVCDLLVCIINNELIIPNEMAKILSSFSGTPTI